MRNENHNLLIAKAPFGYAYHRIIVDGSGKPVDYEFIEVNPAFEKLTGLKSSVILHNTILKVMPEIAHDKFDWIGFYGEIALNGEEKEFEQYSDVLKRWYKVQVYSPEKFFFVTMFSDITNLKEADEVLRESEANYSDIFQTVSEGIAHTTLSGNVISINDSLERILEIPKEQIVGKNILTLAKDLLTAGNLKPITQILIRLTQGKKVPAFQLEYKAKILEIDVSVNKTTQRLTGVIRDMTEQIHTIAKLRETEDRFRSFFDLTADLICIATIDGYFQHLNPAWEKVLGYTLQELMHTSYLDYVHPDDRSKTLLVSREKLEQGKTVICFENRYLCKDGRIVWLEWTSQPIPDKGITLAIARDITGRRLAEEKVREKDIQFRKLSSNLPDLIYQFTRRSDGTYCVPIASEGIRNIFGCAPEDVIEDFTPISSVIYPADAARVTDDIEFSAKHLTYFTCEFRVQIPGRPLQWIFSRSTPEKLADGSITWYGFNANITTMKETEAALIKAKEKAEESDRLKSAFLANMSHEIRTPMNGILGFSKLLQDPSYSAEEKLGFINIIDKSGIRLLGIINDLIDISKIEAGQMDLIMTDLNVNEKLEYVLRFLKPEAEKKGISLVVERKLPDKEAVIRSDRDKITAILINLVSNAIKFTHNGHVNFGYKKSGSFLEFFVEDTGEGIRDEKKEIIFKRFMQGDKVITRNYEGTGLGLSISKAYTEMLGGKIRVDSEYGKGSVFYFTIPYNREMVVNYVHDVAIPDKWIENTDTNLKILVTEDDETSADFILEVVKPICKETRVAKSGTDAVEICHGDPDIDVVLMDIRLPDMDGYEATRKIREFNKDIIIIAQTAFALAGDREKAIEAGCNDYIAKPIDKNILLRLIDLHMTMKKR